MLKNMQDFYILLFRMFKKGKNKNCNIESCFEQWKVQQIYCVNVSMQQPFIIL